MRTAELRERMAARLVAASVRSRFEQVERLFRREPWRTIRAAIVGFSDHNGILWASALTYTSSLALVPVLALALSVLAGVGGVNRLRPLIERYLAMNSPQVTDQLMAYVGNVSARSLGEIGGATLLVTTILTLGTIENAFNAIFNVARGRTWLRKFSDYLSVTFTVPLLVVAAVPIRTHLLRALPDLPGAAWLASTITIWAGFSFLYLFFPNTRVRLGCAAMGGLVAAVALQLGQWGYMNFQVGAMQYQAIYGAIAAVPILLTWIYIAWMIVLFGAELTAAAHGGEASLAIDQRAPDFVRAAALLIVYRAARRMLEGPGAGACTARAIATEMGVNQPAVQPVIDRLKRGGIIVEAAEGSNGGGIFLARDSASITVVDALVIFASPASAARDERIGAALTALAAAERGALGKLTLKDLALGNVAGAVVAHD